MEFSKGFRVLNVAVIGASIGGFCMALAMRHAGNYVTLFECCDFAGEVGAGVSAASNSSRMGC
jgi:salicylate hydroxylase